MSSPFLQIPEAQWIASNALAFAIFDRYPVSPGHALIIPKREVATWFEATPEERAALLALVDEVKQRLDAERRPDGYNIGINAGEAAGQTVMHLHVHLIPRYRGDMADPRGGVRHVIPEKGNYLRTRSAPLATGGTEDPFLGHVRPLFAQATEIAVLAAFVQDSGLEVLRHPIEAALTRGARVRVLTGDYLAITQAKALQRLLDWSEASAARAGSEEPQGRFEAKVVEVEKLDGRSFHPKSWRFEGSGLAAAFVGSSNISRAALGSGIEWNLRVDRDRDPLAFQRIVEAFEGWWAKARPLDADWIAAYEERAERERRMLPEGEEEPTPLTPPEPHELQQEALRALERSRSSGHKRALVVLATGLGKTWLAAFDVAAFHGARPGMPRVLILAHRAELLGQAADTFRRQFPRARFGWFAGDRSELAGDVVLAMVQKLSRPEGLALLREGKREFDYVIVDEVHHATAPSYRRILDSLEPAFLLGLTATPDRADEADVLGMFDDHLAYRADIGRGVQIGRLAPFAYFGVKDDIDYTNIPWRNRQFDPEKLAAAAQTEARMRTLWRAWAEHPGTRTLVFCCSVSHAEFVTRWLAAQGVRTAAVHSAPGSVDRVEALQGIAQGQLDALCTVDLFNEGIDLPVVDRVVMLRPTESSIIFLQQLGRGLRKAAGKERLNVIDFVGNHRVFLERVRTLLSLGAKNPMVREFILGEQEPELPPGCSVELELEAKDLLQKLLPTGRSEVERIYRELATARGERPTIGELFRMGYRPSTLRDEHGSWFEFVHRQGHLSEPEVRVLEQGRAWFEELETTQMSKCFKMIVLEALLEADALQEGLPLPELARRSHAILARSPELLKDLEGVRDFPDPRNPDARKFQAYWRTNPVAAWIGNNTGRKAWFALDGDRFVPRLPAPEGELATFEAMTRELVDYRLSQYRARITQATGGGFEAKVVWNQRDPILKLPRARHPDIPSGEQDVRLPDGSVWSFKLMKEFCNVARPVGEQRNALPDLLRRWFGPAAGKPGTAFSVRFSRAPEGLWIEPVGAGVVPLPPRGNVVAFPSLRAAAGAASDPIEAAPESEVVRLPVRSPGPDLFAVRASGDSMEGGERPIRDGDWLVMRYARRLGLGAVAGKVALVQVPDPAGYSYQVKRVVQEGERWMLRSDNAARPSFEATEETVPIAVLVEVIRPESLAPTQGSQLPEEELSAAFGLTEPLRTGRVEGHLFLLVDRKEICVEPDRLKLIIPDRRPGEAAFVLTRASRKSPWRYAGVGRFLDDENLWAIPTLDYESWRALGQGRSSSRRLSEEALAEARKTVDALVSTFKPGQWIERDGKRCRLLGKAAEGGVRIDGGPKGFAERTVSLTDFAWVLLARNDVEEKGGVLDEARVNRLRYLEGTPKGSTRWIDTGWAIHILEAIP